MASLQDNLNSVAQIKVLDHSQHCLKFDVYRQATNGADPKRRLHLLGFCRSVDSLSEVVEEAVLRRGGSVMLHHVETKRHVVPPMIQTAA